MTVTITLPDSPKAAPKAVVAADHVREDLPVVLAVGLDSLGSHGRGTVIAIGGAHVLANAATGIRGDVGHVFTLPIGSYLQDFQGCPRCGQTGKDPNP